MAPQIKQTELTELIRGIISSYFKTIPSGINPKDYKTSKKTKS